MFISRECLLTDWAKQSPSVSANRDLAEGDSVDLKGFGQHGGPCVEEGHQYVYMFMIQTH